MPDLVTRLNKIRNINSSSEKHRNLPNMMKRTSGTGDQVVPRVVDNPLRENLHRGVLQQGCLPPGSFGGQWRCK